MAFTPVEFNYVCYGHALDTSVVYIREVPGYYYFVNLNSHHGVFQSDLQQEANEVLGEGVMMFGGEDSENHYAERKRDEEIEVDSGHQKKPRSFWKYGRMKRYKRVLFHVVRGPRGSVIIVLLCR